MSDLPFVKMHGLGNDFVILDARKGPLSLSRDSARLLADRRRGVGCDQVILIEPAEDPTVAARLTFFNSDGSQSGACGNGTRCVAQRLLAESGAARLSLETAAGRLEARQSDGGLISVDMGPARLAWQEIPLAEARDTLHLEIGEEPLQDPVGVNMGNPHAVFFTEEDPEKLPLEELGPRLETHPLFPEQANIGVARVVGSDHLRLRVWERGAGLTLACGSGACAAAVAAHRRGLTGRDVTLDLDGGRIWICWREEDGHVIMTGPTTEVFAGRLANGLLGA
jgi:diaminopimelate epimerase